MRSSLPSRSCRAFLSEPAIPSAAAQADDQGRRRLDMLRANTTSRGARRIRAGVTGLCGTNRRHGRARAAAPTCFGAGGLFHPIEPGTLGTADGLFPWSHWHDRRFAPGWIRQELGWIGGVLHEFGDFGRGLRVYPAQGERVAARAIWRSSGATSAAASSVFKTPVFIRSGSLFIPLAPGAVRRAAVWRGGVRSAIAPGCFPTARPGRGHRGRRGPRRGRRRRWPAQRA